MFPEEENAREGRMTRLVDVDGFEKQHSVRPGLMGIAQVYAPRDLPSRQKFRYDLVYVENRSFWLDVRLIVLSFRMSFRGAWREMGREGDGSSGSETMDDGVGMRGEASWSSGD